MYGDLEEYTTDEWPDRVFYLRDNKVCMEFYLPQQHLYLAKNQIWLDMVDIFNLSFLEIRYVIRKWSKGTYKLETIISHWYERY